MKSVYSFHQKNLLLFLHNGITIKRVILFFCLLVLILPNLFSQQTDFLKLTGPYLGQKPPGTTPEIFAPGIVSTCKEHSAAMFSPDGNEIWFGRMFPAKVYYMERIGDKWTEIKIAPFCDTFNYLYPVLSQDGRMIFFSSDRLYGGHISRGEVDIWMVERTDESWTKPIRMNENINIGHRNSCGSVAFDGSLYFTSFYNDRSADIFCSEVVGGNYANPEKLTKINSPAPDHSPFVAPDGSYLIFSSFRGGQGRSDLFISFRTTDGIWSKPMNMGREINSAYKEEYPYVTPDGKYLFFNSNRPSSLNQNPIEDGPGNIYWVSTKIIEELRLKE